MAALSRLFRARRVVAGLVLVLLADAFLLWGDRARPVSVADAVEAFASGEHFTAPPLPASGVYVYDTTGFERVDRLSIRREYPAVTTRTVRAHGASCGYREEVTIFREHVELYDVCHRGTEVDETGFATRLTFYFVRSSMDLTCGLGATRVAPGLAEGESRANGCEGRGVRATVTATFEGTASVVLDDVEVPCRRVTLVTVLRGSTTGGARRALCTDPRTGLVLTEERSVAVSLRDRFVGRVTYTERATFRIRSLVPER